jgi:predicted RNA binding protein YcfA (HicA-like mRNA interferase family)
MVVTQRERLPTAAWQQAIRDARSTLETHGYVVRKQRGAHQRYRVRKDAIVCVLEPDDLIYVATQLAALSRERSAA